MPGLASGVAIVGMSACSRGSLVPVRMFADSAAAAVRRRTERPPGTRALWDLEAVRRLRPLGVPEHSGVQVPVAGGGVPVAAAAMASMLEKPGAHMEADRPLLCCTDRSTSSAMTPDHNCTECTASCSRTRTARCWRGAGPLLRPARCTSYSPLATFPPVLVYIVLSFLLPDLLYCSSFFLLAFRFSCSLSFFTLFSFLTSLPFSSSPFLFFFFLSLTFVSFFLCTSLLLSFFLAFFWPFSFHFLLLAVFASLIPFILSYLLHFLRFFFYDFFFVLSFLFCLFLSVLLFLFILFQYLTCYTSFISSSLCCLSPLLFAVSTVLWQTDYLMCCKSQHP